VTDRSRTTDADATARRHPSWLTLSMADPATPAPASRWRGAIAPVLVLAVAIGYVGVDVTGSFDDPVLSPVPPAAHAGMVALQAVALLGRARFPVAALAVVVALELAILGTSGGQLGIGALAVLVAVYTVWRRRGISAALVPVAIAAATTTVVNAATLALAAIPPLAIVALVTSGIGVLYAAPIAAAEYVRRGEQLTSAQREKTELLERERRDHADRAVRRERTALARELHDVAGHHLSGIIVTAQAASALTRTDPDRARELLRSVQDDARTALTDLRRTVGLLRADDEAGTGPQAPSAPPSLERIPELVEQARRSGRTVDLSVEGTLPTLGPLAQTAAYRMVQESLANAARHSPGTASFVSVDVAPDAVRIVVRNDAPQNPPPAEDSAARASGYGLAGMRERAELIGGRLSTGASPDGGWRNELVIPRSPEGKDA
jgi:signal transduction histidine kinase